MIQKKPQKIRFVDKRYNARSKLNPNINRQIIGLKPVSNSNKDNRDLNWREAKRKYPKLSRYGDEDRDGVPNYKDCTPLDPNRQWSIFGWDPVQAAKDAAAKVAAEAARVAAAAKAVADAAAAKIAAGIKAAQDLAASKAAAAAKAVSDAAAALKAKLAADAKAVADLNARNQAAAEKAAAEKAAADAAKAKAAQEAAAAKAAADKAAADKAAADKAAADKAAAEKAAKALADSQSTSVLNKIGTSIVDAVKTPLVIIDNIVTPKPTPVIIQPPVPQPTPGANPFTVKTDFNIVQLAPPPVTTPPPNPNTITDKVIYDSSGKATGVETSTFSGGTGGQSMSIDAYNTKVEKANDLINKLNEVKPTTGIVDLTKGTLSLGAVDTTSKGINDVFKLQTVTTPQGDVITDLTKYNAQVVNPIVNELKKLGIDTSAPAPEPIKNNILSITPQLQTYNPISTIPTVKENLTFLEKVGSTAGQVIGLGLGASSAMGGESLINLDTTKSSNIFVSNVASTATPASEVTLKAIAATDKAIMNLTPLGDITRIGKDVAGTAYEALPTSVKAFGTALGEVATGTVASVQKSLESAKESGNLPLQALTGAGLMVASAPQSIITLGKQVIDEGPLKAGQTILGSTAKQIEEGIRYPAEGIGMIGGALALGSLGGKVSQVVGREVANIKISSLGTPFKPAESVFAKETIVGETMKGKTFPLTESTAATIKGFEATRTAEGNIIGQTSSPAKFDQITTARVGGRGASGLEDPVLFITQEGKGSPYFTGVQKAAGDIKTYDILKDIKTDVKSIFSVNEPVPKVTPSVYTIELKGISKLPAEVVAKPGFTAVEEFFKTKAEPGMAYITKRSQIGQGEIPAQMFYNEKFINQNTGQVQPKWMKEGGTTEFEAGIPGGAPIKRVAPKTGTFKGFVAKLKGYDAYTRIEGVNIRWSKFTAIPEKVGKLTAAERALSSSTKSKIVSSGSDIQSYVDYYTKPRPNKPYALPEISLSTSTPFSVTSQPKALSSTSYNPTSTLSKISTTSLTSPIPTGGSSVFKIVGSGSSIVGTSESSKYFPTPKAYSPYKTPSYTKSYSGTSYGKSTPYYNPKTSSGYSVVATFSKPNIYPSLQPRRDTQSTKRFLKKRKAIGGFDVYVKRRGQLKGLGVSLSRSQAELLAKKQLKGSLAATAYVRQSGKAAQQSNINFVGKPNEFRQYKVSQGKKIFDPSMFIQENKFRLSTKPEVSEIQSARSSTSFIPKSKKRKGGLKFF